MHWAAADVGESWQPILAGLAGGKGIPVTVAGHPCTFATFTAPSFGPVHGIRDKGPCRARRDKPVRAHGRPLWCKIVGHSTIDVTMTIYAHASLEEKRTALSRLGERLA